MSVTKRMLNIEQGTSNSEGCTAISTITETYSYDACGNPTIYDASGSEISNQTSQIGNRYLFQGREYDFAIYFYYFRARYYNPITGRWLSKDPKGIAGGLNLYLAFGNNPVMFVDPLGLCKKKRKWNPSGHAIIWKGGKIGFFAIFRIEIRAITLKFDNGYFQEYRYISSGIGIKLSAAIALSGDVYGVYSPDDYTKSFWNADLSVGYGYGISWWKSTANSTHSMGSLGATATYQGYWTSGGPYK